jgi:hypothetical protein
MISGSTGDDSVSAGAGVGGGSAFAPLKQHKAASVTMLKALKQLPTNRLNKPGSGIIFRATVFCESSCAPQ